MLLLSNTMGLVGEVKGDYITNAIISIPTEHAYIHSGKMFDFFIKNTLTTGTSIDISITTGEKAIHYRPSVINCSADNVSIDLYEGATVSLGTVVNTYNHNRVLNILAESTIKNGVTTSVTGTKITSIYLPGAVGQAQSRSGMETTSNNNEWILKPNSTYMLRISNGSTTSNTISIKGTFYEI